MGEKNLFVFMPIVLSVMLINVEMEKKKLCVIFGNGSAAVVNFCSHLKRLMNHICR